MNYYMCSENKDADLQRCSSYFLPLLHTCCGSRFINSDTGRVVTFSRCQARKIAVSTWFGNRLTLWATQQTLLYILNYY